MAGANEARIEHNFTYHPPSNDDLVKRYRTIRDEGKSLAHTIDTTVPESREKSIALTRLEEVVMWSNAGIARNL